MPASLTFKYPVFLAQQFLQGITSGLTAVYVFVGHPQVWVDASNATVNDTNPPVPVDDVQDVEFDYWRDMLGAAQVTGDNSQFVLPRNDWVSGSVYSQYDDEDTNLPAELYYVLDVSTLPNRVYKCLWNNGGRESTTAPSVISNSLTPQETSDGYVWQYMYTIDSENASTFLTSNWMPVLSDNTVQANALLNAGQLPTAVPLVIENGGLGYNALLPTSVTLMGDGSGANVSANGVSIVGGLVSQIVLLSGGEGYTEVTSINVFQTGTMTQATARAIIPPYPNHGYNPVTELNAGALMATVEFVNSESGELTISNSYRRIGLLINPLDANGNIANLSFYPTTTDITISANTGVFLPDDVITDTTLNAAPTAVVVDVVTVNGAYIVRVTDIDDEGVVPFQPGDTIENLISTVSATVVSTTGPGLTTYSGDIIWVNQRTPVARANNQLEEIKIVFPFNNA